MAFVDKIHCSFRDPSGFLFRRDNLILRQINLPYKENYDHLMASGLYAALSDAGMMVSHEEVSGENIVSAQGYKIIKPETMPFISYPYEWSFSQLRDAALLTLSIQQEALRFGMSLKDASAYNIQFTKGKPVLIDTLSFEKYRTGSPWVAYRQFCQHFLAPLSLMSLVDIRLNQLLRIFIDGIPLDLASRLLPLRSRFNFSLLSHIHFHAQSQKHFADKPIKLKTQGMSRFSFLALIDSLKSAVLKMELRARKSEWSHYYEDTNYSVASFEHKKEIVTDFLERTKPKNVWDLGANTGIFSRIASNMGIQTISFDIDPLAVENNYRECVKNRETNILPLVLDLTNPSPGIGWKNQERLSLLERAPADTACALALIHHLAISNNLPFNKIAEFFSTICSSLIIEFVPKNDSQVQRLLATREDIFPDYTRQAFETEFKNYFQIQACVQVKDSERLLYLMTKASV